jgi:hypothetical protein
LVREKARERERGREKRERKKKKRMMRKDEGERNLQSAACVL